MGSGVQVITVCLFLSLVSLSLTADPYTYCAAPNTFEVTETNYTLVLVQAFHRHGDRTAVTLLPGINRSFFCNLTTFMLPSTSQGSITEVPRLFRKNYLLNRNVIPGDCYFGQLTLRGYQQHLALGANLRDIYVNKYKFLSPNLSTAEVWIRSTDVYRTIQSAQGNLLGLFPSNDANTEIPVVDMYTMDQANENMVENDAACPRVKQVYDNLHNSPDFVKYEQSQATLRAQLGKALGITPEQVVFGDLFDSFNVLNCYDGALPAGITQDQINQVYEIANWEYNYILANQDYVKLTIGSFVNELVVAINSKIAGLLSQKYLMYSAHDTTIAPLMSAFGVYDGRWPPYASHAQLELWSKDGEYFIQLRYQGVPQSLKGCSSTICPLSQFMTNIAPYILTNPQDCAARVNIL